MSTYTIGFTQKKAEDFFGMLRKAQIKTLIDVRLNNVSQLAAFAKRDDLAFFLRELCNADYWHLPELAPTKIMLDGYKKHGVPWRVYEESFLNLMAQRNIERQLRPTDFEDACLLCSEAQPHHCHRRLVVEYLNTHWQTALKVEHLY